jgi:predicted P-loop ATPase
VTSKKRDAIQEAFDNAIPVDGQLTKQSNECGNRAVSRASAPLTGITPDQKTNGSNLHADIPVVRNPKDIPVWCPATAIALLECHTDWTGCLRHDAFLQSDMLYRPVPGSDKADEFEIREIKDTDIVQAQVWFNRNGFPDATRSTVADAFQSVALNNTIDPLKDWLLELVWDGRPRLSSWLVNFMGAEDSDYVSEVGRRWMISGVARALSAGCKADSCLVLEGDQGSGKSSALRELAGPEFFGDALPDISNKDSKQFLRGKWIIELSELATLNRATFESIKAFISRQVEQYRPAYGRKDITEPRRCVFAGTTNREDYLRDATGNRRFWPVRTGNIDLEAVRRNRDQLWAEAVAAYQRNEPWWLDDKTEKMAAQEQSERGEDDPWTVPIVEFCSGKEAVACKTILAEALGFLSDRMSQRESRRVAGILKSIGYRRDGQFTSGSEKGAARFVRIAKV